MERVHHSRAAKEIYRDKLEEDGHEGRPQIKSRMIKKQVRSVNINIIKKEYWSISQKIYW